MSVGARSPATEAGVRRSSQCCDASVTHHSPHQCALFADLHSGSSPPLPLPPAHGARLRSRRIARRARPPAILGLFGSQWDTAHSTVPRDSVVAQLTIVMIGLGGRGARRPAGFHAAHRIATPFHRTGQPGGASEQRREVLLEVRLLNGWARRLSPGDGRPRVDRLREVDESTAVHSRRRLARRRSGPPRGGGPTATRSQGT